MSPKFPCRTCGGSGVIYVRDGVGLGLAHGGVTVVDPEPVAVPPRWAPDAPDIVGRKSFGQPAPCPECRGDGRI